ncbi:hypothetical protein KA107_03695 [Candidatus Pacearchaeota archaeon]|nr:hypothetical protein [Candidatus Pacearchaeota archaeon]
MENSQLIDLVQERLENLEAILTSPELNRDEELLSAGAITYGLAILGSLSRETFLSEKERLQILESGRKSYDILEGIAKRMGEVAEMDLPYSLYEQIKERCKQNGIN